LIVVSYEDPEEAKNLAGESPPPDSRSVWCAPFIRNYAHCVKSGRRLSFA